MLRQLLSASSLRTLLLSLCFSLAPRLLQSPTHDTWSREFPHPWQSFEEEEPVFPPKKLEGVPSTKLSRSVYQCTKNVVTFALLSSETFLSVTPRLLTQRTMVQKSSFWFYLPVILSFWDLSCFQRRQTDRWREGQWNLTLDNICPSNYCPSNNLQNSSLITPFTPPWYLMCDPYVSLHNYSIDLIWAYDVLRHSWGVCGKISYSCVWVTGDRKKVVRL